MEITVKKLQEAIKCLPDPETYYYDFYQTPIFEEASKSDDVTMNELTSKLVTFKRSVDKRDWIIEI